MSGAAGGEAELLMSWLEWVEGEARGRPAMESGLTTPCVCPSPGLLRSPVRTIASFWTMGEGLRSFAPVHGDARPL